MKRYALVLSLLLVPAVPAAHAGEIDLLTPAVIESDTAEGGASNAPLLSADGRWAAFSSSARNLVTGQQEEAYSYPDAFLHDRQTGTIVLVSHAFDSSTRAGTNYSYPTSISADGRWVTVFSVSDHLTPDQDDLPLQQIFLYDRDTGTNTLVTHSTAGPLVEHDGNAGSAEISADGNWIVFTTAGTDLIGGLTGPLSRNVFLYERATGETRLVSRAAGTTHTRGDWDSADPSISADGRYVAFESYATDLVAGYSQIFAPDVYLFDRMTGSMALVSRSASSATQSAMGKDPVISADGSAVAFLSVGNNLVAGQVNANGWHDAFLYDRATGTNVLVSRSTASAVTTGNNAVEDEQPLAISATGAYVAFASEATDAVAGQVDGPNADNDVFLFARATSSLTLVSRSNASPTTTANRASDAPALSADGRFVAFQSRAADLVAGQVDAGKDYDVFLFDRTTGTNALVSGAGGSAQNAALPESWFPTISADGAVVAYASKAKDLAPLALGTADLNSDWDTVLFDRAAGTSSYASLAATGMAPSSAGAASVLNSASADARYAVVQSLAENLVAGQVDANQGNDVFLVDRVAGTTTLVSRSAASAITTGNADSGRAAISADGNWIVFNSAATDLVPGQIDTAGSPDVFLYERATGTVTLLSRAAGSAATAGDAGCGTWGLPNVYFPGESAISQDGRWIAFECAARNLVAGQTGNGFESSDIFLHDRITGTTTLVSRSHASAATVGNQPSGKPRISADGRWIAFLSSADNLVAGAVDSSGTQDLFLHDRDTGQTLLVSRVAGTAATAASGWTGSPSLSADGRNLVFVSAATNLVPGQSELSQDSSDVFLFDRVAGTVELISRAAGSATTTGNSFSVYPAVDADGSHVAFFSDASNLVPGQSGPAGGVFLHDRTTRVTELVSHRGASRTENLGVYGLPVLSPDARFVAFVGDPPLYLADRQLGTLERIAEASAYLSTGMESVPTSLPALSPDGSTVLFTTGAILNAADDNGTHDVFSYTRTAPGASDFYTITPCRLVNTLQTGPAPVSGQTSLVDVHGACGVPETATAVALNVTVLQSTGAGRLAVHPGNLLIPGTSTLNFKANQTLANNAILPLASNGEGTLGITPFVIGGGTVHVIVDLSGYFQ